MSSDEEYKNDERILLRVLEKIIKKCDKISDAYVSAFPEADLIKKIEICKETIILANKKLDKLKHRLHPSWIEHSADFIDTEERNIWRDEIVRSIKHGSSSPFNVLNMIDLVDLVLGYNWFRQEANADQKSCGEMLWTRRKVLRKFAKYKATAQFWKSELEGLKEKINKEDIIKSFTSFIEIVLVKISHYRYELKAYFERDTEVLETIPELLPGVENWKDILMSYGSEWIFGARSMLFTYNFILGKNKIKTRSKEIEVGFYNLKRHCRNLLPKIREGKKILENEENAQERTKKFIKRRIDYYEEILKRAKSIEEDCGVAITEWAKQRLQLKWDIDVFNYQEGQFHQTLFDIDIMMRALIKNKKELLFKEIELKNAEWSYFSKRWYDTNDALKLEVKKIDALQKRMQVISRDLNNLITPFERTDMLGQANPPPTLTDEERIKRVRFSKTNNN